MQTIKNKLKKHKGQVTTDLFRNEAGAIDLASIMVGVIVIGLIGGVIAATVFTVIPWSQDNAAKQQLDSIASAESAYMGLSSANPSPLPAGYAPNSFGNSAQLAAGKLLNTGTTYCAVTPADGKSYTGYSKSSSGKVWFMTDKNTKPELLVDPVPAECGFTADGTSAVPETPAYVDPTPTLTILTYKCDTTTSGSLPLRISLKGKVTWDDGTPPAFYNGSISTPDKTLTAGKTYKMTFDGTYTNFDSSFSNIRSCLRSMDHWGANTGVTNASKAFISSNNLVAVPDHIPTTITRLDTMFAYATSFNDSIDMWDVSNVTLMNSMFQEATSFNQPLNSWNVSNVTNMYNMFQNATKFNQPLNQWDTSNVTSMGHMFDVATVFNQNIKSWNVAKVTDSTGFRWASALTAANSPF